MHVVFGGSTANDARDRVSLERSKKARLEKWRWDVQMSALEHTVIPLKVLPSPWRRCRHRKLIVNTYVCRV